MKMSIAEVLTALTINGAAAIDGDSLGSLEPGKKADMLMLEFENINSLPYYVGMNCVNSVFKAGKLINKNY